MKKYFQSLLLKLKLSLGIITPFSATLIKNNSLDFEETYIITDEYKQEFDEQKSYIVEKEKNEEINYHNIELVNQDSVNLNENSFKQNLLIVLFGFVQWFFGIKNLQIII